MTGHQGVDALIGFAVALVLASLLAIAALAKERPKDKRRQLEAAYRQFSPSAKPSADLPGRTDIGKVVIDAETVNDRVNPTLVPRTPARQRKAAS